MSDTIAAPPIAITMGDPAGIGPEVTLRACTALSAETEPSFPALAIIGDPEYLTALAHDLGLDLDVRTFACGKVEAGLKPGRPRLADAQIALDCIVEATRLAADGRIAALVTAPVSKRGIVAIESSFRGHTEFLATRAGVGEPLMVFGNIEPAVALLTTHLPLASALASVRRPVIVAALQRLDAGWRRWFGAAPHIAVAGLNPHAGEHGLLGTEEGTEIGPAIVEARAAGADVDGPFPADSIFRHKEYDVILALYHDQGTIMAKGADIPSVNLTLGLPYPRTSPDHGVAYDIAGSNTADAAAMEAAIRFAAKMAANR